MTNTANNLPDMVAISLGSCFISRSIQLLEDVPGQRDRNLQPPRRPAHHYPREAMISDSTVPYPRRGSTFTRFRSPSSPCLKRARDEQSVEETQVQSKRRRFYPYTEPPLGRYIQAKTIGRLGTPKPTPDVVYTREELVHEHGMGLFPWNGRTSHLLLDRGRSIIGILVGRPVDCKDWDSDCREAFEAVRSAILQANPDREEKATDLFRGIFLGDAAQVPLALTWPPHMGVIVDSLHGNRSIQRVCKFASCVFEMFCQDSHNHMRSAVEAIRSRDDNLRQYYDSALGVFPCRTFNSGVHTRRPSMVQLRKTQDHSHSWTSITALGRFDPRLGGHFVLWDLNLIVKFPPGCTIIIPSTLLRYSYTSIQPGDARCSLEQFATAGILEAIEGGCSESSSKRRFTRFDDLLGDKVILSSVGRRRSNGEAVIS